MMNEKSFKSVYKGLLKNKGINIDDDALNFAYACMKDDFTDQQFRAIAVDIYKNEKAYNSIDFAPLFYERLKKLPAREDVQAEINDLIDWIPSLSGMLNYSSNESVENFINRKTTDRQKECLRILGGVVNFVEQYKKDRISFMEVRNKIDEVMKTLTNFQNRLSLTDVKNQESLLKIGLLKEKDVEEETKNIPDPNEIKLPFKINIKKIGE